MESKKHICNKICINTFKNLLKSAIASCILIEKYQSYFVRNIFRAASSFRSSFNKNESRFLLCLSDNLHNVPELAELFIETARMLEDCESEDTGNEPLPLLHRPGQTAAQVGEDSAEEFSGKRDQQR